MQLTSQIKLKPTPEQAQALKDTLIAFNSACNDASQIAWDNKCFSRFRLHKIVYYHLRGVTGLGSHCVYSVIAKVSQAYAKDKKTQRSFKSLGAMPQNGNACTYQLAKSQVSIWTVTGRQHIPFVADDRNLKLLEGKRGEAGIVLKDGMWYLHVPCEVKCQPLIDPQSYLGVDLGIVNLATDSDGKVHSGKQINGLRHRHRKLRSKLQKKGTKSAKRLLKKRSKKEANFAKNENHRISKEIVATAKDTDRGIALEDLKGITHRVTVRKSQRATLTSWSFFQLKTYIEYKAELVGIPIIAVDPRNTSRTCPKCGHIDKANRPNQSTFKCVSCGFSGLADHIAAINIANVGCRAAGYQPNAVTSNS